MEGNEKSKLDKEDVPCTLFLLIKLISKQFITTLRKGLLVQLIIAVIVFLFIFVLNAAKPFNRVSPAVNAPISSSLFWIVLISLISSLFYRVKGTGIKQFFTDLLKSPKWLSSCVENAGTNWPYAFLGPMSLALLIGIWAENYIVLLLAVALALSFTAQLRSAILLIVVLIRLDFNRIFRSQKEQKPVRLGSYGIGILAMAAGLLISSVLPFKPYSSILLILLAVCFMVLIKAKKVSGKMAVFLLGFTALQITLFDSAIAYAAESDCIDPNPNYGEGLPIYFGDGDSGKAAEVSTLSALWSVFSNIVTSIFESLANVPGHSSPAGPGTIEILEYGRDIATAGSPEAAQRAAARGIYDKLLPGMGKTMNPMVESLIDFPNMNF